MDYYTTKEYGVATSYLRGNGLNSITWEHFTGDYKSVLNYLEKIANHIWDKFRVDETEVFGTIFYKSTVDKWDEQYKPKASELYGHTHIVMHGCTDESTYATALTIDELKVIENRLHYAIMQGLEK